MAKSNGEVARQDAGGANLGNGARSAGTVLATLPEIGIPTQRLAEWRELRDAGGVAVEEAISELLADDEPLTNGERLRITAPLLGASSPDPHKTLRP